MNEDNQDGGGNKGESLDTDTLMQLLKEKAKELK